MEAISRAEIITKANLIKRIGAALIDYGIVMICALLLFYYYGERSIDGYSLSGLPALALVFIWAFITMEIEQLLGSTLGNYLFDLKVLSLVEPYGAKPTFSQSMKRHFLDLLDLWPLGLIGILFIKNTTYNQRLGDLWAKVVVVDSNDKEQGIKWKSD